MNENERIIELLGSSHSVFHAVKNIESVLKEQGYSAIKESEPFSLVPGGKYYVTRNGSSVIAFAIPSSPKKGFRIAATHNDSPSFAVKPNPIIVREGVSQINVEPYGGGIFYSWLDRPLSLAGRVFVKTEEGIKEELIDIDEDILVIPSLAIHQNREVNHGYEWNAAKDMVPLWLDSAFEGDFAGYLSKKCSIEGEIVSHDLFLYVREEPRLVGEGGTLLLAPRLDDLSSAYANVLAFVESKAEDYVPVFVSFDNEEVGSLTAQGAMSDFLADTLKRISRSLGWDEDGWAEAKANSILLSADNAHANHPNHLDKCDPTTHVHLNGGIVIKYNADQRYTTNGKSAAYVKALCLELGQPYQEFTNRSDLRGGSTLGNLSNNEVSLLSADIGIAQLAMHSAVELCGVSDLERMVALLRAHYENKGF